MSNPKSVLGTIAAVATIIAAAIVVIEFVGDRDREAAGGGSPIATVTINSNQSAVANNTPRSSGSSSSVSNVANNVTINQSDNRVSASGGGVAIGSGAIVKPETYESRERKAAKEIREQAKLIGRLSSSISRDIQFEQLVDHAIEVGEFVVALELVKNLSSSISRDIKYESLIKVALREGQYEPAEAAAARLTSSISRDIALESILKARQGRAAK